MRDPIHGNIRLKGVFVELADTPYVQRLRHIRQNGLCYLVYPAMNSTRFEHSLGVYHLAGELADHLGLGEGEGNALQTAALLHDVGHGPFSHTFDVMSRYGFDHERRSAETVLNTEVSDILKSNGMQPSNVAEIIRGKGKLGKLLSSEVDVDKMDYLVRDAYYAGVAYGVTDVERLLYSIRLEKGDVVVGSRGLEAAESLLINRNLMYQTVYRHHTKRVAESMMVHALLRLVEDGFDVKELAALDDVETVHFMRSAGGYVGDMMGMLDGRRLFKTVFSERIMSLTEESRKELAEDPADIEARIASDYGVENGYLLIDYPEVSLSEFRVKVKTPEGLRSISEASSLAKSLETSELEKLSVGVYAPPEDREKFESFNAEDYFTYAQTRISGFV